MLGVTSNRLDGIQGPLNHNVPILVVIPEQNWERLSVGLDFCFHYNILVELVNYQESNELGPTSYLNDLKYLI